MGRQPRSMTVILVLAAAWLAGSSPSSGQPAPARGGTLVVALTADPGHLNPAITTSGATHAAAANGRKLVD